MRRLPDSLQPASQAAYLKLSSYSEFNDLARIRRCVGLTSQKPSFNGFMKINL